MTRPPRTEADPVTKKSVAADVLSYFAKGDWAELASATLYDIETEEDRGERAAYLALAKLQVGEFQEVHIVAQRALEWGCRKTVLAKALIAGLHLTLGRLAAIRKDDARYVQHFSDGLRLLGIEPSETVLHDFTVRQLASLGLLVDARDHVNREIWRLKKLPSLREQEAKMKILRTEIALLNQELSEAIKRGHLYHLAKSGRSVMVKNPKAQGENSASTAQLGQDLWVLEQCDFKKGGFFVEFGATDGIALSNTLLLESKYGWKGLLAEPNPNFLEQLKQNRSATISDACIGGRTGNEVEFITADVFGGIADYADTDNHKARRYAYRDAGHVIRLETISLHDFLKKYDAPQEIDYISVDTEGSEYEILKTFPFDEWNVRCWTVEHNFTPIREQVFDLMSAHGYRRVEAQWDDWYVR